MQRINLELIFNDLTQIDQLLEVKVNGCPITITGTTKVHTEISETKTMFQPFMQKIINDLASMGQERTSETYRAALRSFMTFRDGIDIAINDLNDMVIKRYERHMRNRGLSMNTTSFYMRILRAVYHRAVKRKLTADNQPFSHVYTGIPTTSKRSVTMETICAIKRYDSDIYNRRLARDLFMFSFYTHGMSFIDMAYLRADALNKNQLTYHRRKTGRAISMRWEPCMQEIVQRYRPIGPYMLPIILRSDGTERQQYQARQNTINYHLRMISCELDLGCNLTMYMARHSWATIAHALGTPIEVISTGMGHTNTQTTRIYLRTPSQSRIDSLNQEIISSLLIQDKKLIIL